MKFRRTASSVIASVFLVLAVLLIVVQFRLTTFGMNKVRSLIQSFLPSSNIGGIEISADGMESTLMRSLKVNGLKMSVQGNDIVEISDVEVSLTLWDVLKLALGKGARKLDVDVNDVTIKLDDDSVKALGDAIKALSGSGSAEPSESTAESKDSGSGSGLLSDIGISLSIRNLCIYSTCYGIDATSEGINASVRLGSGLVLESAELNIPQIDASGPALGGRKAVLKDIRASIGSDLVAYISVSSGSMPDLIRFSELSAIATVANGLVSAAVYLEQADSSIPINENNLDLSVQGTTISANYGMSDSRATFSGSIENIDASLGGSDISASIRKTEIIGSYDGKEALYFNLALDSVNGKLQGIDLRSSGLSIEAGVVLGNLSSIGQLNLKALEAVTANESPLKNILAENSIIDYSYSTQGLSARIRSSLSGEYDNVLVGYFGADLDISAMTKDFRSLSTASVQIGNIRAASLPDSSSFGIEIGDEGTVHAGLKVSSCLDASADYSIESGNILLNVYITELFPSAFKALYDNYLSSISAIGEDSVLNGNIIISADSTESFSAYMRALHSGEYSSLAFSNLFDLLGGGRVSVNTAVNNLHVGASPLGGAFTLEATLDGALANISTLAVSTGGVRVSYSGNVDLLQLVPEGLLLLQKTSDGSTLASLSFSYEQGERVHSFLLESPLAENLSLGGSVDWNDLSRILINGALKAPFFPDDLEFQSVFTTSPLYFTLKGDELNLALSFGDGMIHLRGLLEDLDILPKEDMVITASTALDFRYYTDGSGFEVNLANLSVLISDSFEVGFDLSLTNHSLYLANLKLGTVGEGEFYYGDLDFTFSDIPSLLALDTSSLNGTVEFVRSNSRTTLRGVATDNQFYLLFDYTGPRNTSLNASLSLLGQRENAFYASASLKWGNSQANSFELNAIYDDRRLSFYESGGNLGSLKFEDLNLVVDFAKLTLDGSVDFRNEKTFKTGETKIQSGKIGISASGQSFSDNIIQALTGQDYGIDFNMSITDFQLSDGYSIGDSQIAMHLENGLLSFSGSLINGSLDTASGYLDLAIEEKGLFGLKARGYFGNELDLLVTDFRFPLPVLNQFMDIPIFSFIDGIIEGDVLIKGPSSSPSLFGMAYCQSYEMTLYYLPDQIITVKNVALSFNDHSLLISRTPIAGYSESDGRYFYGDLSLDIILQGLGIESFDIGININNSTPLDFWFPARLGEGEIEIRGGLSGYIGFGIASGKAKIKTDIVASSMLIDFRVDEEMPSWFGQKFDMPFDMDVKLTTGHDVELYYPEKESPFINFTLAEDRSVRLVLEDGVLKTSGAIALKTGQVYYFQNDFIIKEGSVDLSERNMPGSEGTLPVVLNLRAEITDYDSDGNKVVISLILQNTTLDNINPRFSSNPSKSENEILAMLGQSVLASGALDRTLSLSSVAKFAATAREALTRVGVLESNKNYSITGTVRSALGLDIFSARSNILSNVIIDALPGEITGRADVSILARYLDRTSLFAGKYIGEDWFVKVRLMLKADSNVKLSKTVGHFLAKDLILDTEISLDWETPMGTLSVFTQPQELSVFDILDTIGFSVTKQIQY